MTTLIYHIKLLRPLNVLISGVAMVIASAILGKVHESTTVLFVVAIVMCYTGAANSLNDIMDYEIDLINRPLRPIPSGHVQKKTALIISMIRIFIKIKLIQYKVIKNFQLHCLQLV